MKTLIYLCYGQESIFRETTFSILSTLRFPSDKSIQIVVYSDRAECFADLGLHVRTVTDAELNEWMGGSSFSNRRKMVAVIDALQRYGDSVAFLDCDTYFLKSPGLLFELIGPGRSCLHIAEGKLKETHTGPSPRISQLMESQEFCDLSGNKLVISPDAMMWNSGVIGVHPSDLLLMHEALNLCDQLCGRDQVTEPAEQRVHTWEQFAMGVFLARNELSEASDIVFHYWRYHLRGPFTKKLEGIDSNLKRIKLPDRAYRAYKYRPRETVKNAVKIFLRTWMRRVGWRVPGIRTST